MPRSALAIALLSVVALSATSCQSSPPRAQNLETAPVSLAPIDSESETVVRLAVFWDATDHVAPIKLGTRLVRTDAELAALLKSAHDDAERVRKPASVQIDAAPEVPWRSLMTVLVACRDAGFASISFALPEAPK